MKPGFTALGHPSSIEIGQTHGVFVLDDSAGLIRNDYDLPLEARKLQQAACVKFLHKPNAASMTSQGAVITTRAGSFVYTDSAYFFDHATAVKLLDMFRKISPLSCEIDAYGDFLQALGPNANRDYTGNTANVSTVEKDLVAVREAIFHHLKGTPLNVLVFNNSEFHHIGTIDEFLEHYSARSPLFQELGAQFTTLGASKAPAAKLTAAGTLLATSMTTLFADYDSVTLGANCVLEYCSIGAHTQIGEGCILR